MQETMNLAYHNSDDNAGKRKSGQNCEMRGDAERFLPIIFPSRFPDVVLFREMRKQKNTKTNAMEFFVQINCERRQYVVVLFRSFAFFVLLFVFVFFCFF